MHCIIFNKLDCPVHRRCSTSSRSTMSGLHRRSSWSSMRPRPYRCPSSSPCSGPTSSSSAPPSTATKVCFHAGFIWSFGCQDLRGTHTVHFMAIGRVGSLCTELISSSLLHYQQTNKVLSLRVGSSTSERDCRTERSSLQTRTYCV